ncbi:MAG: hypothetical protein WCS31_02100 [Verrucomicrobiae bacterium]
MNKKEQKISLRRSDADPAFSILDAPSRVGFRRGNRQEIHPVVDLGERDFACDRGEGDEGGRGGGEAEVPFVVRLAEELFDAGFGLRDEELALRFAVRSAAGYSAAERKVFGSALMRWKRYQAASEESKSAGPDKSAEPTALNDMAEVVWWKRTVHGNNDMKEIMRFSGEKMKSPVPPATKPFSGLQPAGYEIEFRMCPRIDFSTSVPDGRAAGQAAGAAIAVSS